MEISGLETAIMGEAKGYETLIMCYHYCHGYCYSWLSMQGKEDYKILCNPGATCGTITKILKETTAQSRPNVWFFLFGSHDDIQYCIAYHHSYAIVLYFEINTQYM